MAAMRPSSARRPVPLAVFVATVMVATLLVFDAPGGPAAPTVSAAPAPGQIDTFAGTGANGNTGDGGAATDAAIGNPGGLAVDTRTGDVYVSLPAFHVIRRIDPSGQISTVAGTSGTPGATGDGADATRALLSSPRHLAIGPDGALYIADHGNDAVRRIDLGTNTITTIVGPSQRFRELTHPGHPTEGYVMRPWGLAFQPTTDGSLRLAVSTEWDSWIRLVDVQATTIATIAGTRSAGFSGDGGPATDAQLSGPRGIAYEADGGLLVVDRSNHRVRRIDANGDISTILGDGRQFWEDGDGRPAAEAYANFPNNVVVGSDGSWYLSNSVTLKRIGPDGIVGTIAGLGPTQGDGGPSVLAQIRPGAMAFLPDGRLLVAEESFNHRVRVIVPGEPPLAPAGVSATAVDDRSLQVDINPAAGLTRLHEVTIEPPLAGRRSIDERRNFYSEMPQAVLLDPSMIRTTTFADLDARAVTRVSARGHNGWGYGPARTFDLVVEPDPDPDDTCRWAIGSSGSWHDPTRWSCGGEQRVPTIDDDVVIDVEPGGTFFTVTMASNAEARSLVLGGDDTGRTQRQRLVMTEGISTDPRTLTLGAGPFIVERSGMLTTGRPTVFGVSGQRGWLGRITGQGGTPVDMTVHGEVEAFNMELTGDLTVGWPPGVTDGQPGYVITRGASWATGSIDIAAGGAAFVIVYRGEEPDQTPRPPRFAALAGDLTIAEGGDLRIWHETDTTGAATDGQTAVAVPNGRLLNHGRLRVDGRTNIVDRLGWTMTIDGPVDNHGRLVTGVQGVRLGGPTGTVHTNSGEIVVGDRTFTTFTEQGGPLVVNPGTTLSNSGTIIIDRTRRLHGTVLNEGGLVTRTTLVSFDESVDLGIDGPQPVVGISHDGAARPVTITWYGSPHPYVDADARVDASSQWWAIDVDPVLSAISLSLPRATDRDDPVLCRHLPGDDANPTLGWDCLDPDGSTTTTLTVDRNGAIPDGLPSSRSEWTVGGTPPSVEPEPYAFDLFDVDEPGPDLTNAVLLGQLSSAVYRFACGAVVCAPGVDPSNAEWFAAFEQLADDWRFTGAASYHDDITGADALSIRTDDALLFAFRGTEGITNFRDVAIDAAGILDERDIGGTLVPVHRGFWIAVDALYDELVATASAHPDLPIWVTGHSLGGAMAPLAAIRLHAAGFDVRGVHTFGAPQVGGPELTSLYDAAGLGAATHHWLNDRDPIPKLLAGVPGYDQTGRLHVMTRLDEDDELEFSSQLDAAAIPGWDDWSLADHDITRTVRRLHSLLSDEERASLPTPYADPADAPFEVDLVDLLEWLVATGAIAPVVAAFLLASLDVAQPVIADVIELLLIAGASIEFVLAVIDEMYDATREVIIATLLEVLERLGLLVERIVEAFRALAAVLGVTLDEFLTFLADLGLDEETFDEIVAILTDALGDLSAALRDLFETIRERLLAWLAQFGLDLDDLPPLLPDDLGAVLDLNAVWESIRSAIYDQVDAALDDLTEAGEAGLAEFIEALEGLGFVVVHAPVPGAPEPPPGDIVEFLWTIELLPDLEGILDELGLNTDGLLGGLAAPTTSGDIEADLDAALTFGDIEADLAAALTVTLRFGVDELGPYLAPDTGLVLDLDGSIGVDGTAQALGAAATTFSGSTAVELGVVVAPTWTGRVRLDDAALLALPGVTIDPASTATTEVSLSRDLLDVTWTAAASYPDGTLDLDAAVAATLPLPGFTDDEGDPATISLSGERVADTWVLQGALDTAPVTLGPVTIDQLDVGPLTIAPGIFTGQGSGELTVEFGGASESADLSFTFGGNGVGIEAGRTLTPQFLITVGGVDLARIDGGRIGVDVTIGPDGTTELGVGLLADALVLLPNLGSDGALVISGIDAQVGTDGGLRLDDLDEVALALPGGIEIVLDTVTIDLGGSEDDPILTAATGTLAVPGLGLTGQVTELEIGRDGVITVATATGSASPTDVLGDLAGFLPFQLTSVEIDFPQTEGQPIRLDEFVLTATGTLDLSLLEDALGADIEVRVGDTVVTEDEFTLQIVVESVNPLVIAPVGIDAVTVAISGLDIGPLAFDAEILFDAAGGTTVVSGSVTVTGAGLDLAGSVSGTVTAGVVRIELDIAADATPFAGVDVEDFELQLVLTGTSGGLMIDSFAASATVAIDLDGDTLTIPLAMSFEDGTFEIAGGLQLAGDLPVGFGDTTVLVLSDPEIGLELVTSGGESTLTIDVAASGFELFPDLDGLVATGAGVTGSLSNDGSFALTAATLTGTIAGTFTFGAANTALTIGPDTLVVVSADSVDGAVPDLGLAIEITDLEIRRDGSVSVGSINVATGDLEQTLGIAGLFPFTLADGGVTIDFDDPDDPLSAFTISVTGAFDLSKLDELGASLGFTPILRIGDRSLGGDSDDDGVFTFAVAVDVDAAIPIRPVDLPPITLGFDDLTVGPLTFGADITFSDVTGENPAPTISGTVRLEGGIEVDGTEAEGSLEVSLTGTMTFTDDGAVLALAAGLLVSGSLGEFIVVEDLAVDVAMTLSFDGSALTLSPPTLGDITYSRLEIVVTDLVSFTAANGTIDLGASEGQLLAEFGDDGLGIRFGDGAGPLAKWGGAVSNVGLRMTSIGAVAGLEVLVPVPVLLPGFAADITLPGADVGFPDWVPLDIRSIGFTLPDDVALDLDALAADPLAEAVEFTTDLFTGLRLRLSGGLEANNLFPITADLEGLELSISRLIDCALAAVCENPIIDLDGIAGGVEPFALGPLTIGGVLGVGFVPVPLDDDPQGPTQNVFYVRIAGEFTYSGIGAGVDLVISEYGPVLAKVVVPLAIPLAQTTLLLTGVKGGIQLGGSGFTPLDDPVQLLTDPGYDLAFPITLGRNGTIASALRGCAERNQGYDWSEFDVVGPPECFTWNDGGTLTLGATLTSYAAPGLISGDVTLAVDLRLDVEGGLPNLRFAGNGNINVFGFPVGTAGFLLSLDDPLAPVFDLAILAPAPGSPLGFVMPAQGQFTLRIDTEGIALGTLLGLQTFLTRLGEGSLGIAQDMFADAFDELAAELEANRHQILARLLLDVDGDGELSESERAQVIDTAFVIDRVLGTNPGVPGLLPREFPTDVDELRALLTSTTELTTALQQALFGQLADVAGSYTDDLGKLFTSGIDPLTAAILATQGAIDEFTSPMTDERAQALAAYGRVFREVLEDALNDSTSAFFDVFDPTFALEGDLQPVILGMPLGEPIGGASLIVNRQSVELGLTASPTTFFLYSVLVAVGAGAFSPALAALNDQLGVSDRVTVRAQLPVSGLIDTILAKGPLAIDPFDAEWNVALAAQLTVAGLTIGELEGLLVSPRNDTVLDNRIWRTYDPSSVFTPSKIPVRSEEQFEAIRTHGGLLLTASLDAPSLLVDPVATLGALDLELPENLVDYPDWVQQNVAALRALEFVGEVQLFLPSLDNLINPNIEGSVWTVDYTDDAGRFDFDLTGEELAAAVMEILDDAYLEGSWRGKILGIEVTDGRIRATTSGYEVEVSLPFLDEPVEIRLGGSTVTIGGEDTLMPSALLDVEFRTDELIALMADLGLPDILGPSGSGGGGRLRIATPGYDVKRTDDPLLVRGGIEATADLSLAPFVDSAEFEVSVFPGPGTDPFASTSTPDFVARASVDRLRPLAGDQIVISDAVIEVRRLDGVISVTIEGQTEFGGNVIAVDAQLASDLTGVIDLSTGGGTITIGGFEVRGGLRLELTRANASAPLVIELRSDITVSVPAPLAALIGTTEVSARGAIASDGTFDLELEIDQLDIPGTGLSIVGPDHEQPGTVRLARTTLGVEVEVFGQLTGATGLPVLNVSGELDENGDGSLDISFPDGGLDLRGFSVEGGASIERDGDAWSVAVVGSLTIPGLFTGAAVTGSIDQDGIDQLAVAVSSFDAGVLQITDAQVLIERVGESAAGRYRLAVQGTVTAPGLGTATTFSGTITPAGDVEITLTTTSRNVQGVEFSSAEFTLRHTGSTTPASTTLTILGTASVAQQSASVNGVLERNGDRWIGSFDLAIDNFQLGGVAIAGSVALVFDATTASLDVNGTLSIPGLTTSVGVSGLVTTGGFGILDLDVDELRPGGPNSPFRLSGSFLLERSQDPTIGTRFTATAPTLAWEGLGVDWSLALLQISTTGAVTVTTNPLTVDIDVIRLELPAATFTTGANGLSPLLSVGATTVRVTGVFPTTNTYRLAPFDVGITGDLDVAFTVRPTSIGAFGIDGTVRLRKVGGTWSIRITGQNNSTPARLTIPGIQGSVDLDQFVVSSDGAFDVAASGNLGNGLIAIRDADLRFVRSGTPRVTRFTINGGTLHLPIGRPIPMPSTALTIDGAGLLGENFPGLLDLGPLLRRPENFTEQLVPLRLELTPSGFELRLRNSRTFRLFSSNLTLDSFVARSDGTVEGELRGALNLPIGDPNISLGTATFQLSRTNGVTRVTVPSNAPISLGIFPTGSGAPTGTRAATVSGWADSSGRFSFTGSATVDVGVELPDNFLGIQLALSASGSVSITLTNDGLSAQFQGGVCTNVFGIENCSNVTRTVASDGTIAMPGFTLAGCWPIIGCNATISPPRFPLLRPVAAAPDLAPPQVIPVADWFVEVPAGTASVAVHYPLPVAIDDRDPNPVVTCTAPPSSASKPPGSSFGIGTTRMSCTARDSSNKVSAPQFFDVVVRELPPEVLLMTANFTMVDLGTPQEREPVLTKGDPVTIEARGFLTTSTSTLVLRSDPVLLGSVETDDEGVARFSVTVPDVPAGPHTLLIDGIAPDGRQLQYAIPVTIAVAPSAAPAPAPSPSPSPAPSPAPAPAPAPRPGFSDPVPAPSNPAVPLSPRPAPPELVPPTADGTGGPVDRLPATGGGGLPTTLLLALLLLLTGALVRSAAGTRRGGGVPSRRGGSIRDQHRGPRTGAAAGRRPDPDDGLREGAGPAPTARPRP